MFKYQSTPTIAGCVIAPNSIASFDGFYISHNSRNVNADGEETTAIVIGQMLRFFILTGDHRKELIEAATAGGVEQCLAYFRENIRFAHSTSEHNVKPERLLEISPSLAGIPLSKGGLADPLRTH